MTSASGFVFEPMECRECGRTIVPISQKGGTASSPSASIYLCECGYSYSNSRNPASRTAFAPTAEANVPQRFRPHLKETLSAAANVQNRTSKYSKFRHSTSEDAVTWTIFRWLQHERALASFAEVAGSSIPNGEPEILFWGAAVGGLPTKLSRQLEAICIGLDAKADRLSEPDVVLTWPEHVFFVEVKYQAKNEHHKPGSADFSRYTSGSTASTLFAFPPDKIAEQGWHRERQIALNEVEAADKVILVTTPYNISLLMKRLYADAKNGDQRAARELRSWLDRYPADESTDIRKLDREARNRVMGYCLDLIAAEEADPSACPHCKQRMPSIEAAVPSDGSS